ncbi:MAG: GTPase Era [Chitinophagaceae bacterium]|nr:GTPase Era [Chitinophagaceae bacterium]
MKSGFVSMLGLPNAGKSTLLNALIGEKLAIVSPKVQTTRHRIKGILTGKDYQLVFSDTPGIIEPEYKLHEKMMKSVREALNDADLALLVVDVTQPPEESDAVFSALHLSVPAVVVLNKTDQATAERIEEVKQFFSEKAYCRKVYPLSALLGFDKENFIRALLEFIPENEPYFPEDEITDLSTRFFVSEIIREKIFHFTEKEIPYHSAVQITRYKEQPSLVSIAADIIVQRESQKIILIGEKGSMIKKIGTEARKDIEEFLGRKVFLELHVKVRPDWRNNETYLRQFGYG